MNVPGNGNAHKSGGVKPPPLTGRQTRGIALQSGSQSSDDHSSSVMPLLGSPSRFRHAADGPALSLITLPADVLFHTAVFLDAMDLVLLSRTCKSLYRVSGDIQRSASGGHWNGDFNRRIIQQRQLTQKMFSWLQERQEQSCTRSMQSMVSPATVALESPSVVDSTAASIGSRFRHVSFAMNGGPLIAEIGAALANADGWNHLELLVSDIRPLAGFLQQLVAIQTVKRSVTAANGEQPDRQLSIHFRPAIPISYGKDLPVLVDAMSKLQTSACGVRIASLFFPHQIPQNFLRFIEGSQHIEHLTAPFDWDAAPLLDALRSSSPALRSLSLHFSQVDFDQPEFGRFFEHPLAWNLDRLSIHASRMDSHKVPLDFLGACNIRDIRLHGVEFESNPEAEGDFGAAVARNTAIHTLELKYCRFLGESFGRLLGSLQSSTTLKCLMLHHNIGFGDQIASAQVVDSIGKMTSLCEVHLDKGFKSKSIREIGALQVARPDLRIFVDKELISHVSGLSGDEPGSGCYSDSDDSTAGSDNDPSDSDYSIEGSAEDSSDESEDQQDFMADIEQVIRRAKDAEKQ